MRKVTRPAERAKSIVRAADYADAAPQRATLYDVASTISSCLDDRIALEMARLAAERRAA